MSPPPWSPPCSGQLRRCYGSSWVLIDAARDSAHPHVRRSALPFLCWMCACSTLADADEFFDELRRSAPPRHSCVFDASYVGGAWFGTVWPQFGAAVAGLCHRAAMDASMNTPGKLLLFCYPLYSILSICSSCAYWFLLCICCCYCCVLVVLDVLAVCSA
jgi:hypothetical protein